MIQSIWGNRYVAWEVLNAINTAGGVLLLWDKRVLELIDSTTCHWKGLLDGFDWVGTGLYGPTRDEIRPDLWSELKVFASGGFSRGVFLETSMLFGFQTNAWVAVD